MVCIPLTIVDFCDPAARKPASWSLSTAPARILSTLSCTEHDFATVACSAIAKDPAPPTAHVRKVSQRVKVQYILK